MSAPIRWFTVVLLILPIVFLVAAQSAHLAALDIPAVLMVALYAAVWLFIRPTRFELTGEGLEIVFPGWTRTVAASDGLSARTLDMKEFRQEFGLPLRIGVGGLWGGFGWLWTTRRGRVEFYISRTNGLVLIERQRGGPILITPESPELMVDALGGGAARSAAGF
jgi:hypothetical protein